MSESYADCPDQCNPEPNTTGEAFEMGYHSAVRGESLSGTILAAERSGVPFGPGERAACESGWRDGTADVASWQADMLVA